MNKSLILMTTQADSQVTETITEEINLNAYVSESKVCFSDVLCLTQTQGSQVSYTWDSLMKLPILHDAFKE